MKKLLTVLLTVMLAFTTIGINVLAETDYVVEEVKEEVVEVVEQEEVKTEVEKEPVAPLGWSKEVTIKLYNNYNATDYTYSEIKENYNSNGKSKYTNLTTPTREGYTFDGWYSAKSGGDLKENGKSSVPMNDTTSLYAHWTKVVDYYLKFTSAHGTAPEDIKFVNGKATLPAYISDVDKNTDSTYKVQFFVNGNVDSSKDIVVTKKDVYHQTAWYGNPAGTPPEANYDAGYEVANDNDDRTFSAVWETVTTYSAASALPTLDITGYDFVGWKKFMSQSKDFDGGHQLTSDEIKNGLNSRTMTLSAVLTAKQYEVTFVGNFEGSDYSEKKNQTYDSTYVLPSTNPTREGYDFAGWYTEDGTLVTTGTTVKITGPQTLYAHWNKLPVVTADYKYTNADGSEKVEFLTVNKFNNTYYVTKPSDPIREGYVFLGWYEDSECTTPVNWVGYSNNTLYISADKVIYANWKKIPVVTIDYNYVEEGKEKTSTVVARAGGFGSFYIVKPAIDPTRVGYDFVNWYTDAECKTPVVWENGNNRLYLTGDKTIYVKWNPKVYTVTYLDPFKTISNLSPATYTVESKDRTLPTGLVKDGFEFEGWYAKLDGSGYSDKVTSIPTDSIGNVKYYAKWKAVDTAKNVHTKVSVNDSKAIDGYMAIPSTKQVENMLESDKELALLDKFYSEYGNDIDVWVDINEADSKAETDIKEQVSKSNSSYVFDAKMYTKLTGLSDTYKHELNNPGYDVEIVIRLSAAQVKGIYGQNKNYYVMRGHYNQNTKEVEYEKLPAKLTRNADGTFTLSFASDKFSVFMLYSKDKVVPTPTPKKNTYVAPKTGVR